MKNLFSFLCLALFLNSSAFAVDFAKIEKDLTGDGLVGWIHGSVPSQNIFVFTYRSPDNFFDYVQMSLISENPEMIKTLATYARHDKVKIKGSFFDTGSPQRHIAVESIEMVKKFTSGYPSDSYDRLGKIPDDLTNLTTARFLVHAIVEEGQILVVEYKDAVLPIFVKNGTLTKDLARNDIVELNFRIQKNPNQPVHLRINEAVPNAVKVVQSIRALDQKTGFIEGALVLFPKSPEISIDVFAVEELLADGLKRQYTIVNFDSADLFEKARAKLHARWDQFPGEYMNGRNKLISKRIRVRVSGVFNNPTSQQANPQILFTSLDDIQFID
jgi:hypothetical protein